MIQLSIDIETYSSVNLLKSGVYAYADAPDFTILLFAYAFDNEDIKIVDIACGEKIPDKVLSALIDENISEHRNAARTMVLHDDSGGGNRFAEVACRCSNGTRT